MCFWQRVGSVWGRRRTMRVSADSEIRDCRELRASSGAERFVCKTVQSDVLSLGNEAIRV